MRREYSCGAVVFTREGGDAKYVIIENGAGGCHGFPKGHVEPGETDEQTAHREVREEISLDLPLIYGFREEEEYPIPGTDVMKHVTYFLAEYKEGEPAPQEGEIGSVSVVPLDEALSLLEFESARRILRSADKFIKDRLEG